MKEPSWEEALRDAEDMIRSLDADRKKLDRRRAQLRTATRLIKQLIEEGAPWPGKSSDLSEAKSCK